MNKILTEKKKKKKPSAQSQVHNKVNSGLMETCISVFPMPSNENEMSIETNE